MSDQKFDNGLPSSVSDKYFNTCIDPQNDHKIYSIDTCRWRKSKNQDQLYLIKEYRISSNNNETLNQFAELIFAFFSSSNQENGRDPYIEATTRYRIRKMLLSHEIERLSQWGFTNYVNENFKNGFSRCFCCTSKIGPDEWEACHIIPESRGGLYILDNLRILYLFSSW